MKMIKYMLCGALVSSLLSLPADIYFEKRGFINAQLPGPYESVIIGAAIGAVVWDRKKKYPDSME